ncbi:hypothetical protein SDC9_49655 [bioreactor metagenome]|uniref:Uncharacterized protein n=1 Tax=bioreactor metagenome TaxID=1076179 RepID=A0A644WIF0_9ZZZZ
MTNAAFRHHGNRDGFHDSFNHFRIAHAGNSADRPDIRRNPFQCHHRTGAGRFRNLGLLRSGHIHNYAAL